MLWVDIRSSALLRRFALRAILAAFGLACVLPSLQLLVETTSLRISLPDRLAAATDLHLQGFDQVFTSRDEAETTRFLDAFVADPVIDRVTLTTLDGRSWSAGPPGLGPTLKQELHLRRDNRRTGDPDATMVVEAALPRFRAAAAAPDPLALATTFALLLTLVTATLLVVARIATRPIQDILDETAATPSASGQPIRPPASPLRQPDELDDILVALNRERAATFDSQLVWSDLLKKKAQLTTKLSDTHREQADFAYAVAHDLKSPSNTIIMLLNDLRSQMSDRIETNGIEILDDLDKTAARLARLIQDVIEYSISASRKFAISEFDLETEIKTVVRELFPTIKSTRAEINMKFLPRISGNAFQARTLFRNLISNALKFHAKGSAPMIEISGTASRVEGWVEISVRDNGIGIAPQFHGRIFEIFTRLHRQVEYEGSGIGLTLCQRIALDHGGRIEVDSREGAGSTFTVYLPGPSHQEVQSAPPLVGQRKAKLKIGVHTPKGHIWNDVAEGFSADLTERTQGDFSCQVAESLRMSTADDILEQIQSGALDFAFVPAFNLCDQLPEFASLLTPFVADDVIHAGRILRSDPVRDLEHSLESQAGFIGAGTGMAAMRQFLHTGRLTGRADFPGLKLGILPHGPISDFFEILEVDQVPIPMHQAPHALENGQIDAVDITHEMVWLRKLHEGNVGVLHSDHMMYPFFGGISEALWQRLGAEDRKLISGLLTRHVENTIETYRIADPVSLDRIRNAGCPVTILDRRPFASDVEAWATIWAKLSTSLRPILDAAEQTREHGPDPHQNPG
ncbi:MAG: TRAP transporter substrate-binding protein DctP [Silicimonas sp.]|nr:TRAP transporter substrate-binding protein DctP [Silicimonas sp.]